VCSVLQIIISLASLYLADIRSVACISSTFLIGSGLTLSSDEQSLRILARICFPASDASWHQSRRTISRPKTSAAFC
jgi:hypothetical protein